MIGQYRIVTRLAWIFWIIGLVSVEAIGATQKHHSRDKAALDSTVLVARFERCLKSNDTEEFAQAVSATFREATLAQYVREGDVSARRASIYALGTFGSYRINAAVASGLKDPDSVVRAMADRALRAIWYRADTPENNERLRKIMVMIDRGLYNLAIEQADALVKIAPDFAEAYNQRAIAHFFSGRPAESAADCRKTLERNPYHLGALGGLGQCLIRLNDRVEAIKVFRRASSIDPYNESLKATIAELEAAE